jgi:adenosyl cobinamide kinase/adenosyl cobinamide phosphate guanylyltransferase
VIVTVLGGIRSGKSQVGETIAARFGDPVTVVVAASPPTDDPGFAARVAAHRARRPPHWTTIECGGALVATVERTSGTLLIDSLGTWVAATEEMSVDTSGLVEALRARRGATVIVSEEVGLSVHPPTELGLRFADAVGAVNAAVVAVSDVALLVVGGRVLRLADLDELVELPPPDGPR